MGALLTDPRASELDALTPLTPALPPKHADVAVVGGGIVGLLTAYRLVQAGLEVAVLDPAPASEATYGAAGMLASISEVQYRQEPLLPLMRAAASLYPQLVEDLETATGLRVGWRSTVTLVCAADSADRQHLTELSAYQGELGLTTEPMTVRAARRQEPVLSPTLSGAVRIVEDHQINPRWLARALLMVLDGRVHRVTATGFEVAPDGASVSAVAWQTAPGADQQSSGRLTATSFVLANGLGANALTGIDSLAALPLRPVHGDVLRLRIPESQRPFLTSTVRGVVRGYPVYLVPREDNTLVLGATAREDRQEGVSAGGVYQLLRDARELVPAIDELEIYEVVSRARPGSPDDLPLLGTITHTGVPLGNLTLATGFFRHGILLAPWAAGLIARRVTGTLTDQDKHDLTVCNPARFSGPGASATLK